VSTDYFRSLSRQFSERSTRAALSYLRLAHPRLRDYLQRELEGQAGSDASLQAAPVFEALFEYESTEQTLESCGLLHAETLRALDQPPERHIARRFPGTRRPYRHQLEAWRTLKVQPPRSVVVSTGTASGKTECFLVPILDDLVCEAERSPQPLEGVRALFLYPLNALINSQKERLAAWTARFENRVRFCLFNGGTPDNVPADQQRRSPEEVLSRRELRRSPPPILVTNATMLEYMLLRKVDAPIIEKSGKKLRWIVLDEAHTYLGSNAAEISLLLRRVMHAFDADPQQVRFVATSATIGSGTENESHLQKFLADLAGISPQQVTVISGSRVAPPLTPVDEDLPLPSLTELQSLAPDAVRRRLERVPAVRDLRLRLTQQPLTLSAISQLPGLNLSADETLKLLDYCSESASTDQSGRQALLPLRGNFFLRTQPGLWACCNPECSGRTGALKDPDWHAGAVFASHQKKCRHCDSLVFELVLCDDCGEVYLAAEEEFDQQTFVTRLQATVWDRHPVADDLRVNVIGAAESPEDSEGSDEEPVADNKTGHQRLLLTRRISQATFELMYDVQTGEQVSGEESGVLLRFADHDEERLVCCRCGHHASVASNQFRSFRIGSPFFLGVSVPVLLQHTPGKGDRHNRPQSGRQLITFTDSRQGTARFAARSQREAERSYVRSFVYHKLWQSLPSAPDAARPAELQNQIDILEKQAIPGLQSLIEELRMKLARLQAASQDPVGERSWEDMVSALAEQPELEFMTSSAQLRYSMSITEPRRLAEMLLTREFVRRSRREVTLETLGAASLVYEKLATQNPPAGWLNSKRTSQDWVLFLKLCVDFVFRAGSCVSVTDEFQRWSGTPVKPRTMMPPDTEHLRDYEMRWPTARRTAGRRHRIVSLLTTALELRPDDRADLELLDGCLRAAYQQICISGIVEQVGEGVRLHLRQASLRTVNSAWLCPVTQRPLDAVLLGVSPFQTVTSSGATGVAEPVRLPALPSPFRRSRTGMPVDAEEVNRWLQQDERVVALRQRGVWTEFHDRLAELSPYFEVAEHSAQLSKSRLQELESRFREGRTNVLSCSTTMEMGIDIGGLSAVAMNNAPPGPANWLQRAGRAGRRDLSRAATLTMCQNQPHGEAVFQNPVWPFTTPVHVPRVSLNSRRIVQRHINAFLLGWFLRNRNDHVTSLNCRWFFASEAGAEISPCSVFQTELLTSFLKTRLTSGVQRLIRRSTLEGVPLEQLFAESGRSLRVIQERWCSEHQRLLAEVARAVNAAGGSRTAEERATGHQLKRHEEEFLLRELSSAGFLPTHGFPIYVLPFVNTSWESLEADRRKYDAEKRTSADRDTAVPRMRNYPSRELPMAIREYAPGSTVVIDGLTYRSEGLTLHWQLPPSDDYREVQAIGSVWRCPACGAFGTSGERPLRCPQPGCESRRIEITEYIQPSGFAVDVRDGKPTAASDLSSFVPYVEPWISCEGGAWMPLANPVLGQLRVDSEGLLFHQSAGSHGFGYALCLQCGRAASEKEEASTRRDVGMPLGENGVHRRLREARTGETRGECPGSESDFSIRRNIRLGGRILTDVMQLRLRHPLRSHELPSRTVATSLAIALRTAFCRRLGIDPREIGWTVRESRENRDAHRDIFLYDAAAGGSGYVTGAPVLITDILKDAHQLLERCQCDAACHRCLLDFDTQHHMQQLDRRAVLQWLDDDFLKALELPEVFRCFGEATRHEPRTAEQAILLELLNPGVTRIRLFVGGDPLAWDLDAFNLLRQITGLTTGRSGQVAVVLSQSHRRNLPWALLDGLARRCESLGVQIQVLPDEFLRCGGGYLLAEICHGDKGTAFASFSEQSRAPGSIWGNAVATAPLVRGEILTADDGLPWEAVPRLTCESIVQERPNSCQAMFFSGQLNGPVSSFGGRFWDHLLQTSDWLRQRLQQEVPVRVEYSDRHLSSPLTVRLLLEVLRSLLKECQAKQFEQIVIRTREVLNGEAGHLFQHEWASTGDFWGVLNTVFGGIASGKPEIELTRPGILQHARTLRLCWASGMQVEILLDEGLGFMHTEDLERFPFAQAIALQAAAIEATFRVQQKPGNQVPVYLLQRQG
jgi:DEAD/DEAH box helicase domain-containing protein